MDTGLAHEPSRASSARSVRPTRIVALGLALLVAAVALVIEGRSVVRFHTFAPWSAPDRIHYCGRDYDFDGDVSVASAEQVDGASRFKQLTRGPLWQPIYGHPATTQMRRELGVPCAMVLYMRDGDAGYRSYVLSGGP